MLHFVINFYVLYLLWTKVFRVTCCMEMSFISHNLVTLSIIKGWCDKQQSHVYTLWLQENIHDHCSLHHSMKMETLSST